MPDLLLLLPAQDAPLPPAHETGDGVSVHGGVPYAALPGARPLELDLYLPIARPAPVVVFVHGGGWRVGSRHSAGPAYPGTSAFEAVARAGIAVASVDHRLSGEAVWPAQLHDVKAAVRWLRARADEVLDFLTISHVAEEKAGNLSGGQKKLLELGRTMMVDAKIVFLDEVGAGVNRTLLNTIGDAILRLNRERGYTFCMIEHDMDFVKRIAHKVTVMHQGRILAEGPMEKVQADPKVIDVYLGH